MDFLGSSQPPYRHDLLPDVAIIDMDAADAVGARGEGRAEKETKIKTRMRASGTNTPSIFQNFNF